EILEAMHKKICTEQEAGMVPYFLANHYEFSLVKNQQVTFFIYFIGIFRAVQTNIIITVLFQLCGISANHRLIAYLKLFSFKSDGLNKNALLASNHLISNVRPFR